MPAPESRELWSAQDIAGLEERSWVHFLDANAAVHFKSLGGRVGFRNLGVQLVRLEPGRASAEQHRHYHEEELVYILAGTGVLLLGEERQAIGPGDFIGFPCGGRAHALLNTGDQDLLYLCVGQRLKQEMVDYPRQGKRLYVSPQGWDMVDLNQISDPLQSRRS